MKRSLVLTLVLFTVLGVTALAIYEGPPPVKEEAWNNLPESWRFNLTTFGEFGARNYDNANFQIAGFIETKKSLRRFFKEGGLTEKEKLRIESTNTEGRFASRSLRVYVYSYGNSIEPFDPANFSFSQNRDSPEYSVDPATITGFNQDKVMAGKLSVPKEIDIRETFYIHYKYGSEQVYLPVSWNNPYPKEKGKSQKTEEKEKSEESGYDISPKPEDMFFNEHCRYYEGDEYCFKEVWVSRKAKEKWRGENKPGIAFETPGGVRVFTVKTTIDEPGDAIVIKGMRNLSADMRKVKDLFGDIVGRPFKCDCDGPDMDCTDFKIQFKAQTCYVACARKGYGDVFNLDKDEDYSVCEDAGLEELGE